MLAREGQNVAFWSSHVYCKNPKNSDSRKIFCNHSNTKCLFHRVLHPKDADQMANSVNPDQTAPLSLIWVYTISTDPSVRKLRIIMVSLKILCPERSISQEVDVDILSHYMVEETRVSRGKHH